MVATVWKLKRVTEQGGENKKERFKNLMGTLRRCENENFGKSKKRMTLNIRLWLEHKLNPNSSWALGSLLIGLKGLRTGPRRRREAGATHSVSTRSHHQLADGLTTSHWQGHPWCQLWRGRGDSILHSPNMERTFLGKLVPERQLVGYGKEL